MDTSGGIVARAAGLNADKVRGSFDNTEVYPLLYETLFGEAPGGK
jgi:glycerophosphoryl diester phosphodiesterase